MNDARVDHINETLTQLNAKVDSLSTRVATHDDLKAGFARAFEQTQGGFDDHRAYTEFVVERSAKILRTEMGRRFDGMDDRFDRLEKLIKDRPAPDKRPRFRT